MLMPYFRNVASYSLPLQGLVWMTVFPLKSVSKSMNLLRDNGSLADSKTDKPSSHSFIEGNQKSSGVFIENASSSSPSAIAFQNASW